MKGAVDAWMKLLPGGSAALRGPADERMYVIGLDAQVRKGDKEPAAHAIALYVDPRKKQIFDPNHGEFEFGFAADVKLLDFCGDPWSYYRRMMNVASWTLH